MKTRSLLVKLSKQFPKRIAKKYHDYVGLMVGPLKEEVHKILLCLDFDEQILDEALRFKPDLIITHHPFFYGSKVKILKYDEKKAYLNKVLTDNNIPLYSMHTNFDEGREGMNDALSAALDLENVYAPEQDLVMRIGSLKEEMTIDEFCAYAKNKLRIEYGLLVQGNNHSIKKVGIIGGGGSRSYVTALNEGCDIYISGDAPHYVRRDIILQKFNYLDVPHEVEHIFMPQMEKILHGFDSSLEILALDHEVMPKVIK